jgi:putative transposase
MSVRPDPPRAPGATIFFSVRLAELASELLMREVSRLRAAVAQTRTERTFGIDAWVALPDHMHFVCTLPDGDRDFSTRIGAIKAHFTRHLGAATGGMVGWNPTLRQHCGVEVDPTLRRSQSKQPKSDAGVWQRRFWDHHIRNEADCADHVRYCSMNPVKHGYAAGPANWPYSSWHRDMGHG